MIQVTLEDIMTTNPIKIKESIRLGDVAHLLLRYQINGILIVSDDNPDDLVGICTTTDCLALIDRAFSVNNKMTELSRLSDLPVGDVSTKNVLTFQKETKVTKAIALMHRKNIHTLPIYDGDKLVGVVGRHDILNIAFS